MTSRPVFDAELGAYFADLRAQKGWTQRQAEDIAARRGLQALTRQVLWRLEKGKTKHPSAEVLRAVAALYDLPAQEVLRRVIERRFGGSHPIGAANEPVREQWMDDLDPARVRALAPVLKAINEDDFQFLLQFGRKLAGLPAGDESSATPTPVLRAAAGGSRVRRRRAQGTT